MGEADVHRSLEIIGYLGLDREVGSLENRNVLSVQEKGVAAIGETNKTKEFLMAIGRNVQ